MQLRGELVTPSDIFHFRNEYVDVPDDKMWRAIIHDQPWTPSERRKRMCVLLESKIRTQDPAIQFEGLHGLWELVVNKDFHADLTDSQFRLLVENTVHDDIHCATVASMAIWTVVATQETRRKVTDLGACGYLIRVRACYIALVGGMEGE